MPVIIVVVVVAVVTVTAAVGTCIDRIIVKQVDVIDMIYKVIVFIYRLVGEGGLDAKLLALACCEFVTAL
jgi:hypothetical protein